MLTNVEVINSQGSVLNLPLHNFPDGYILQNIEGLDPVKANLVTSNFANVDGLQYHSSRREARNIKIQLGLEPSYTPDTVRTLRNALYKFFMPKTEARIRLHIFDETDTNIISQNRIYEIVGRIETFESPLFVKEPAVDISFMCFDPDFIVPTPVIVNGMSTADLTETTLTYDGTVETGIEFTLTADRTVDAFTIYHRPPDGSLRILDFTQPLLSGDVLKINTNVGSKRVTRVRTGVESSLLYGMTPQSNWLEFQPGNNVIRVYAVGAAVPYTISYIVKLGGL